MLKSFLLLLVFAVVGLLAGIISWINWGFLVGLEVFVGFFLLGFIASAISVFFIKTLSMVDVFLPIPISLVWCVILFPLKVSTDLISPATMIASAFLLTYSLWMYKQKEMTKGWIIIPTLMFLYEMLPITFPGPVDDLFAVGGSTGSALLQSIVVLRRRSMNALTSQLGNPPPLPEEPKFMAKVIGAPCESVAILPETGGVMEIQSILDSSPSVPAIEEPHLEIVAESENTVAPKSAASLSEEVKALGVEVVKMAWSKPKIKQAIIDKTKMTADALKARLDRSDKL